MDRDDLWPKIRQYERSRFQFRWEFGLNELPKEPGFIVIRGARQTGKSTWLEFKLLDTLENFGKGSAFVLNGDEIYSHDEFEKKLLDLEGSFSKNTKVRRIFIDELTSIPDWERVVKRLVDQGHLSKVLLVTTGSNAADLRHGAEKLPGRKGKLKRSDYIFLPISYREYLYQTRDEIGQFKSDTFWGYLLSGGSPLGISGLAYDDEIDDSFRDLLRDWIVGDIVGSGRGRIFLLNLLRQLYSHGASRVSYTNLARDSGLANNSAALDYIEKLADLSCVLATMQWDHGRDIFLARKSSKIHFINLAVALTFHPKSPKSIHEVKSLKGSDRAMLFEWLVAQELWRRYNLKNQMENLEHGPVEGFGYWASKDHEIDFVTPDREFYEVKSGKVSAQEFAWFHKVFPTKKLHIICENDFETDWVAGQSPHRFLLSAPTDLYYDEDKYRFDEDEV